MSADNGIYILRTLKGKDFEYRVRHLQAVENVNWHRCSEHGSDFRFGNDGKPGCEECKFSDECEHLDCHIANAREMWDDCVVYKTESEALTVADKLYDDCYFVEYGICTIKIDREF